jgi:uncharacterized membrane protein YphA (DoxX/SURF4 family)
MKQGTIARTGRIAAAWLPALFLALVFAMQGTRKFSDASGWATAFHTWGYPAWFRYTIGAIELLAAALLLWGRTAVFGAGLIICVMLGGMATHILKDGGRHLTSELGPIVFATIILVVRRDAVRGLISQVKTKPMQASGWSRR